MIFEILIAKRGFKNKKVKESADEGSFRIMIIAITTGYWLSYIKLHIQAWADFIHGIPISWWDF